jgi:hypothetical protein
MKRWYRTNRVPMWVELVAIMVMCFASAWAGALLMLLLYLNMAL